MQPRTKVILRLIRIWMCKPETYRALTRYGCCLKITERMMEGLPNKNDWNKAAEDVCAMLITLIAMPFLLICTIIASIHSLLPALIIEQKEVN